MNTAKSKNLMERGLEGMVENLLKSQNIQLLLQIGTIFVLGVLNYGLFKMIVNFFS